MLVSNSDIDTIAHSGGTGTQARFWAVIVPMVLGFAWMAFTVFRYWNNWAPDLSAIYFAGHFYANGEFEAVFAAPPDLFSQSRPEAWAALAGSLGYADELTYPFVYPPIWAAAVAPLTQIMGPFAFFNLFLVVQSALAMCMVFLTYRLVRPAMPLALWVLLGFGLLVTTASGASAFFHNQLQISVSFLTVLAFERLASGKSMQAGMVLALAAAIKLSPVLLVLIFLVERDRRAILAFLITGGALGVLSLLIAGIDMHLVFLERLRDISGVIAVIKSNYGFEAFLATLFVLPDLNGAAVTGPILDTMIWEPLWISVVVKLALILAICGVLWRSRKLDRRMRIAVNLVGMSIATTLFGPLSWAYHYMLPLLFVPLFLQFFGERVGTVAVLAVFALGNSEVYDLLVAMSLRVHLPIVVGVLMFTLILLAFVFGPKPSATAGQPER